METSFELHNVMLNNDWDSAHERLIKCKVIVNKFFFTTQKMEFSITDFFSKYNQFRRNLVTLHLLKKSSMENVIFCAAFFFLIFSRVYKLICKRYTRKFRYFLCNCKVFLNWNRVLENRVWVLFYLLTNSSPSHMK